MFKNLLYYFLILFVCFLCPQSHAASATPSLYQDKLLSYPAQISHVIETIHKLPEARKLISFAQKEGYITIKIDNYKSEQFEASWDARKRTIFINNQKNSNEGAMICSLLFELYNACSNTQMTALTYKVWNRQIDKDTYVEQMERLEHNNALSTVNLIETGIDQGIFPKTTRWPIFQNFDDHYIMQQLSGHSHLIAYNYDALNSLGKYTPYRGTIPGLKQMSQKDKDNLAQYLSIKRDLESPSWMTVQTAKRALKAEYQSIQTTYLDQYSQKQEGVGKKRQLLQLVFKRNPLVITKI